MGVKIEYPKLSKLFEYYVANNLSTQEMCLALIDIKYNPQIVLSMSLRGKSETDTDFLRVYIKTEEGNTSFSYFEFLNEVVEIPIMTNNKGCSIFAWVYKKTIFIVDSRKFKNNKIENFNRKSIKYRMTNRFECVLELSKALQYLNEVPTEMITSMPSELQEYVGNLKQLSIGVHRLYYNDILKGLRLDINNLHVDVDVSVIGDFFGSRYYEDAPVLQLLSDGESLYTEDELSNPYDYIGEDEIKQKNGVCNKFIKSLMSIYVNLLFRKGKVFEQFTYYMDSLKDNTEGLRALDIFVNILCLAEGIF